MKVYAIKHEGQQHRWVFWHVGPRGIAMAGMVEELNPQCLVTHEQAEGFLQYPGIDPRYKLFELELGIPVAR